MKTLSKEAAPRCYENRTEQVVGVAMRIGNHRPCERQQPGEISTFATFLPTQVSSQPTIVQKSYDASDPYGRSNFRQVLCGPKVGCPDRVWTATCHYRSRGILCKSKFVSMVYYLAVMDRFSVS